jgi:hypothetical protein
MYRIIPAQPVKKMEITEWDGKGKYTRKTVTEHESFVPIAGTVAKLFKARQCRPKWLYTRYQGTPVPPSRGTSTPCSAGCQVQRQIRETIASWVLSWVDYSFFSANPRLKAKGWSQACSR